MQCLRDCHKTANPLVRSSLPSLAPTRVRAAAVIAELPKMIRTCAHACENCGKSIVSVWRWLLLRPRV